MRFLIPLLLIATISKAQNTTQINPADVGEIRKGVVPVPGDNQVYNGAILQVKPVYPGGVITLQNKIAAEVIKNADLPKNFSGKIYLSFVVEKNGSLTDIKTLHDPGYKAGLFAERTIRGDKTRWSPGILNGIPVRSQYLVPVEIKMKK